MTANRCLHHLGLWQNVVINFAALLCQTSICYVEEEHGQPRATILACCPKQVFPGLERPSPACPRDSCPGSGPSGPESTCLAFFAYRDMPPAISGASLWNQGKSVLPISRDFPQRLPGAHLCKRGTTTFPTFIDTPWRSYGCISRSGENHNTLVQSWG